jgi:nucleoid-associated protein YgaU
MSDVEKYGLVAVVFVGGLLLVIATQGGFGGGDSQSLAPEIVDSAAPLRSKAPAGDSTVRVVSVLPDTPFHWDEPPVPYPGRRSAGQPQSAASGEQAAREASADKPAAGATPKAQAGTHVVAKGETLEDIAAECLGSKTRWKELIALNPGLDPRKLQIGQVLHVAPAPSVPLAVSAPVTPPAAAAQPVSAPASAPTIAGAAPSTSQPAASAVPAAKKGRTHTVAKGDTLGGIAKKYLGSSARADEIYQANTDVLKNKNDLDVGQVLRIP